MIRTGTGSIELAARRDIALESAQSVIYTAGRPGSAVDGFNNPTGSPAPIFPNQGGDIGIDAGGDIRAAGSTQLVSEWLFRDAKRTGPSALRPNPQTAWWVRFDQFQQGIGALAGGDVTLKAGGDLENVSAVIPTNARLGGPLNSAPVAARFVEQGGGDLVIDAGGNVAGGLYYVSKGTGSITAGGSVTTATTALTGVNPANPFLALGDATFTVTGRDSVAIESAFNPTSVVQSRLNTGSGIQNFTYAYTYAETSAVKLVSARGDVALSNDLTTISFSPIYSTQATLQPLLLVYPGKVEATAYAGNAAVRNSMLLYPSKVGDFNLFADDSVSLAGNVFMSDVAPSALPSVLSPETGTTRTANLLLNGNDFGTQAHTNPALHADDRDRVEVIARTGDIVGVVDRPFGNFAKPVLFEAGGDIRDVWVVAQNLRNTDRSVFRAGGDFLYSTARDPLSGLQQSNRGQIVIGGPGELLVEAGRSIDLGNSSGLVTNGNISNPFLPEQGAAIRLNAGGAPQGVSAFIQRYVAAGDDPLAIRGADLLATMRARTGDVGLYLDDAIARLLAGPRTDPLYSVATQLANARSAVRYRGDMLAYLRGIEGETGFVTGTARDRFEALPSEAQAGFVNHVLFAEVKAGGSAWKADSSLQKLEAIHGR